MLCILFLNSDLEVLVSAVAAAVTLEIHILDQQQYLYQRHFNCFHIS